MTGSLLIEDPETGDELEVEYTVSGGYYPATRHSPEEFPEVEFHVPLPAWANEDNLTERVLEQERDYADDSKAEDYYAAREAEDYDY